MCVWGGLRWRHKHPRSPAAIASYKRIISRAQVIVMLTIYTIQRKGSVAHRGFRERRRMMQRCSTCTSTTTLLRFGASRDRNIRPHGKLSFGYTPNFSDYYEVGKRHWARTHRSNVLAIAAARITHRHAIVAEPPI
jgi:hypothetical protein